MLTKIGERAGRRRRRRASAARSGSSTPLRPARHSVGDWIVYRTLDDERHLWQIVETLESGGRDHVVVSPVGDPSRPLVRRWPGRPDRGAVLQPYRSGEVLPGRARPVLAEPARRELIDHDQQPREDRRRSISASESIPRQKDRPGSGTGSPTRSSTSRGGCFDGGGNNALRDIFDFIAQIVPQSDVAHAAASRITERRRPTAEATSIPANSCWTSSTTPRRSETKWRISCPCRATRSRTSDRRREGCRTSAPRQNMRPAS